MVQKINDYEIAGYSVMASNIRRSKPTYVYFVARFNQPISKFGTWEKGQLLNLQSKSIKGASIGAYVNFDKNQSIHC